MLVYCAVMCSYLTYAEFFYYNDKINSLSLAKYIIVVDGGGGTFHCYY